MRTTLALAALALLAIPPATAQAQPGPPPGSYRGQCSDIRMEGQFLHATCRGAYGRAQSSINVLSCASDIYVDANGGLACQGPGAAPGARAPGYAAPGYAPPAYGAVRPPHYQRDSATVFARRNFRGASLRLDGAIANLDGLRFNDRVGSIRLEPRSGPWQVCSDADFRGRCVTLDSSVRDVRRIGLDRAVSSLRPLR